jgi:hypothetical protein
LPLHVVELDFDRVDEVLAADGAAHLFEHGHAPLIAPKIQGQVGAEKG